MRIKSTKNTIVKTYRKITNFETINKVDFYNLPYELEYDIMEYIQQREWDALYFDGLENVFKAAYYYEYSIDNIYRNKIQIEPWATCEPWINTGSLELIKLFYNFYRIDAADIEQLDFLMDCPETVQNRLSIIDDIFYYYDFKDELTNKDELIYEYVQELYSNMINWIEKLFEKLENVLIDSIAAYTDYETCIDLIPDYLENNWDEMKSFFNGYVINEKNEIIKVV